MLSLVPPHQAGRLAVSLRSASLPSPPLRIVSQRRAFATIVQRPSAAFEDLPEPPIEEGKESALDTLNITAAAERQLARIQERERDVDLALRILVESGGCHGYSTKLQLASISKDKAVDDYVLSAKSSASDATQAGLLLVDALTLSLIRGSTLDYATELIGSSFRLVDNPQASGKGCGCGVSWELKI
ncbi:MAG: [4Fe-4S] proteins maturation [Cyphobasidiales sp. Tagirdzhanova-0007]|nr:MAG: [4Fe-4S] proteins maturation [Cyphobasidiales sp. Tagirdzhanova-0007]